MGDQLMTITINSDENGAILQRCPYCNGEFKVYIADWKSRGEDIMYCAHCGLKGSGQDFIPQEVINENKEALQASAINMISEQLFGSLKNNKFLQVTKSKPREVNPRNIDTVKTNDGIFTCIRCKKEYRIPSICMSKKTYCPFCGEIL